jgi:hypothetical protein
VPIQSLRRWRQQAARRRGAKLDEAAERGVWGQWFLLVGRRASFDADQLAPTELRPLYPPLDAFWADPFLWSFDGRHYVFFEERRYASKRGRILALELDRDGCPVGEAVPVLEEPYHLSYPFLFELDGNLYMVPEKSVERRVDLYVCTAFPDRWERVMTLIDGMALSDSTLFEHRGLWWLFAAVRKGRMRVNETLFAFFADNPLTTRWTPHPTNPLVRDFSRGRPGGRIQPDRHGRLLRPAQDCVRRYGHGLSLNQILELSPTRFAERAIWHGSGPEIGGWRAMHHLDWHNGLMAMDAQRLIPEGPMA